MHQLIAKHPGFRWRLTFLLLSLPFIIVSLIFIWQDYHARKAAIVTQVELKSAQVNAQLEDFVHSVQGISMVYADLWGSKYPSSFGDAASVEEANTHLAGFVANHPQFSEGYITDLSGMVLVSSGIASPGERIGPAQLYNDAVASDVFMASDVIVPSEDMAPYALFVQPLNWRDGSKGFLVLQSELTTISGALDMSVGFPESAKSGIFDSQGRILAGTGYEQPHPGLAVGRDISKSAVWEHARSNPTTAWFGPGLDKIDRIIFFGYPDSTPWITTVAFAQSELFNPIWSRIRLFAGALVATLIAVFWIAEILIRRERSGLDMLEEQRVTLDAAMRGATDGIIVVDNYDNVTFANRRFLDMLGLSARRVMGMSVDDLPALIAEGDPSSAIEAQVQVAMEAGDEHRVNSLTLNRPNSLDLEISPYSLYNSEGHRLGRTVIFHDVTKAKTLDRMKTHLLATASHQLRTPMTVISGHSELLLKFELTRPEIDQSLRAIHSESVHMNSIINSMLNLSEMESGRVSLNIETFDAESECVQVIKKFETKSLGHRINTQIPATARLLRADKGKFVQVLENLLDNAIKYSMAPSTITISASKPEDGMVTFSVADTGIGIPEGALKDLFSPFYRVIDDRTLEVPGTGLGLYVGKNIAELHGGKMWAESEEGRGTSISFSLPAAVIRSGEHRVSMGQGYRVGATA